ncbi:hypothetical protein D3C72_1539790 [compost metagenome]
MQLDHQERTHQEQHQRQHFGNRPLGLAAGFHRTAGFDRVAHRQFADEIVDLRLEVTHQVGRLDIATHRSLDGDGRFAVATPDQRLLQLIAHGGEGQQRNRGAVGGDDLQVLQGLRRTALTVYSTGDDVDQVDVVVDLSDLRAADNAVHDIGHVLGRQAKLARLVLRNLDP